MAEKMIDSELQQAERHLHEAELAQRHLYKAWLTFWDSCYILRDIK